MVKEIKVTVQVEATAVEITLKILPATTEGEILDAISRTACEAYQVIKKDLDTCPTK